MTKFLQTRVVILFAAIAVVTVAGVLFFATWINNSQADALSSFVTAVLQRQAIVTGGSVASLIELDEPYENVQNQIVQIQSRYPEVASLAVLIPGEGKFRVVASTESQDLDTVVSTDQYSRAFEQSQTITFQREIRTRQATGEEQTSIRIVPVIPVQSGDQVVALVEIGYDTGEVFQLTEVLSGNSIVFINLFAVFTIALVILATAALLQRRFQATETAQKLEHKDELLASAAHDLGGPLIGIRLDVEELQGMMQGNEEAQRLLTEIHDTVAYETNFLQDLLIVSRFERGKEQVFPRPVFLQETFKKLFDDYLPRAQEKGLQLELNGDLDNLPKVIADPDKIGEVFMNYLSNAIKYSDKGTVNVTIQVKQAGKESFLVVGVKDQGVGIAEADLPKLFKSFSRVGETKKTHQGTGLGLYIVKQIIESHGGRVSVSSTLGEGSTFFFSIPVPDQATIATEEQKQKQK